MNLIKPFDTSTELLVKRYKNGIQLVRPGRSEDEFLNKSIGSLFHSSLNVYFFDTNVKVVDFNDSNIESMGLQNRKDILGRRPENFFEKAIFAKILRRNNEYVISQASVKITEESGINRASVFVQTLGFKFPWYHEDRVIGLFGCSIRICPQFLSDFPRAISHVIAADLFPSASHVLPVVQQRIQKPSLPFSTRETEVLKQMILGKTAREIGETFGLSRRTVENYINNIKIKSNCGSKSQLISKYMNYFMVEV